MTRHLSSDLLLNIYFKFTFPFPLHVLVFPSGKENLVSLSHCLSLTVSLSITLSVLFFSLYLRNVSMSWMFVFLLLCLSLTHSLYSIHFFDFVFLSLSLTHTLTHSLSLFHLIHFFDFVFLSVLLFIYLSIFVYLFLSCYVCQIPFLLKDNSILVLYTI